MEFEPARIGSILSTGFGGDQSVDVGRPASFCVPFHAGDHQLTV
jgi:hypothetical protein